MQGKVGVRYNWCYMILINAVLPCSLCDGKDDAGTYPNIPLGGRGAGVSSFTKRFYQIAHCLRLGRVFRTVSIQQQRFRL